MTHEQRIIPGVPGEGAGGETSRGAGRPSEVGRVRPAGRTEAAHFYSRHSSDGAATGRVS